MGIQISRDDKSILSLIGQNIIVILGSFWTILVCIRYHYRVFFSNFDSDLEETKSNEIRGDEN